MHKHLDLSNHKIIFVHIPKTAGTTLNKIIEQNYRPPTRFSLGPIAQKDIAHFKSLSEAERAQIQMLNGHLAYGLHDYMLGPTAYFTVLREPIDRILSFYYFVERNPQHYLYDFTHQQDQGILGYLEHEVTIMVDNFQTRLVSGVWDDYPFGQLPEQVLELAKENLRDKFAVVGLTERFDETLLLLQKTFGWEYIYYTKQNVTHNRPTQASLDSATLAALRKANWMDIALYDYAQGLFADEVRRQGATFLWQLWHFRLRNRLAAASIMTAYWRVRRFSVRVFIRQQLARLRAKG